MMTFMLSRCLLRMGLLFLTFSSSIAWSQRPVDEPSAETEKPDPIEEKLTELRALYHAGDFEKCFKETKKAENDLDEDRRFTDLKARCKRSVGDFDEALELISDDWLFESSQQGQMLTYDLLRDQGKFEAAEDIPRDVLGSARFASPSDLLAIGRAVLLRGGEPKDVLDRFYKRVRSLEPKSGDAYYHIGELALNKYDYELAAENFDRGLQIEPNNADLRCGLARAFYEGDRAHAVELLEENLEKNPNHVDSLLMMARHHLIAEFEDKSEVTKFIKRAEKVNGKDPRPNAMRAVMARLKADEAGAKKYRDLVMKERPKDPSIDYQIGQWMSSLMRFSEAVPYLRASLKIDPGYLPAKIALGQNLLRVGKEEEAWQVLESVHDSDQYNIAVYNLLALHDEIQDYQMINGKSFIVRMEAKEAALFGDRVLALLEKAERELHPKYGFTPSQPILVEFFPNQEDFAVRTLGFMGADGLLGACFGLVVTMNSPGNGGAGKSNWESTLWHEYCHAVTLTQTKNRMPRWLTEGISVYEERLRDPTCGENMSTEFRYMILEGDELIPLNQLNYGFLRPKSGKHMMFAYYQSSLFIEYFMEKFGEEKMRALLVDLRNGVPFSEACKNNAKKLSVLEKEFIAYAKKTAESTGEGLDWVMPEENLATLSVEELAAWLEKHPNNYYGLRAQAATCMGQGEFDDAKAALNTIIEKYPNHVLEGSPYLMLAEVHKRLGDIDAEREALWTLVSRSTKWLDQMLTLLDYEVEAENWPRVIQLADKVMAINPYITKSQKSMALGLTAQGQADRAVRTYERLLTLDPPNPAQVHFSVAKLVEKSEPDKAKRHTLDALAEAPRYREALAMLLALQEEPALPEVSEELPPGIIQAPLEAASETE